jgi:2-polyprenyl-3-methyl-5-hydroxy-6-metoxy-1,4-benzoquinol methylase
MSKVHCCPICEGEAGEPAFPYHTLWNGVVYDYYRCRRCQSTYINPLPTDEQLKAIYAWSDYHDKHYATLSVSRHRKSLSVLAEQLPEKKTLLDFGCGNGDYLIAARRAGLTCCGVEYEAETIKRAQANSGVTVMSLDELERGGRRFDIIRMCDVLPHLPDPASVLRRLEAHCAPGGVFLIEGPLENNPSLVFFIAAGLKGLRRRLGLDGIKKRAPTMLVRLNQKAQREFFTKRLNYRELYFELFETGWPYYVENRPLFNSFAGTAKQAVGYLAIILSRMKKLHRQKLGNRFIGIYQAKQG